MKIIPDNWRNKWSSDEVRVLILASLGMQIGLIFLAPLRKRSTNTVLTLTLWLLYLTADYVATLALGNISRQTNSVESGHNGRISGELTVLWAPFLLLHLGGPDSITSYSIEDNELWWRHLLGLVVQVLIAVYVFWQSPPNRWLWISTILVFIPGLIKFAERTHALRLGSKDNLKDKIISELVSENENKKVEFISNSEIESEGEIESERESQVIFEGYGWFNIFKRLLVDVTFTSNLLMQSQDRFSDIKAKDALDLVAIELSFLYDILHTKADHMHCLLGRVLRFFSVVSIIAALIVFHHLDMQKYASKDIIITYILFSAGLSLEVIAIMFLVSSDWMVVSLRRKEQCKCFASAITAMVKGITCWKGKPRWSRTIGHYNLIGLCLRDRGNMCGLAWIMRKLKIKKKWDNMCESRFNPLPELLEDIMFTETKRRAQNVHIYNVLVEARSYRGSKALERHDQLKTLEWSMRKEFDECIILWHVATDICYYKDTSNPSSNGNDETETETKRTVSWKTSNYMVYLLTQQQSMMQLGYGKTRFEATCTAVKDKFKGKGKLDDKEARKKLEEDDVIVPGSDDSTRPAQGPKHEDDKRKVEEKKLGESVLKDGRRLAKELQEIYDENIRWQLISETWMEMLGYAAIHCDSYQHAKSLSRGGELLTHLWLLMAQMGVVEEHKIQQFQSGSV